MNDNNDIKEPTHATPEEMEKIVAKAQAEVQKIQDAINALPEQTRAALLKSNIAKAQEALKLDELAEKIAIRELQNEKKQGSSLIEIGNLVAERVMNMLSNREIRKKLLLSCNIAEAGGVNPEAIYVRIVNRDMREESKLLEEDNNGYIKKLLLAVLMTDKTILRPVTLVRRIEGKLSKDGNTLTVDDLISQLDADGIVAGSDLDMLCDEIAKESGNPTLPARLELSLNQGFNALFNYNDIDSKALKVNMRSDRDPDLLYFILTPNEKDVEVSGLENLDPFDRMVLMIAYNFYKAGLPAATVNTVFRGLGGDGEPTKATAEDIKNSIRKMRKTDLVIKKDNKKESKPTLETCLLQGDLIYNCGVYNNKSVDFMIQFTPKARSFENNLLWDYGNQKTAINAAVLKIPDSQINRENMSIIYNLLRLILMKDGEKELNWETAYWYAIGSLTDQQKEQYLADLKSRGEKAPWDVFNWRKRFKAKVTKYMNYWRDMPLELDPIIKSWSDAGKKIVFEKMTQEDRIKKLLKRSDKKELK